MPETSASPDEHRWTERWVRSGEVVPCVLLALLALLFVAVHAPQHDRISPLDEYSYIDYVARFPDQGVVRQGSEIGPFARDYYLCHGIELFRGQPEYGLFAPDPSRCGDASLLDDDADFPQRGKVSADIYTPAYFAVTWVVAKPLQWAGADDVLSWRLAGGLWLAAAAALLYLAARRWGASRPASWASSLFMVGSPAALWSNTYVSTDATAFFAGALMLWAGASVRAGRWPAWTFALAAVAVTMLKLQNFLAVGAVSLALLALYVSDRRRDPGERRERAIRSAQVRAAVLGAVAPVAAQVVWVLVRARLAVGASPDLEVSTPYDFRRFMLDLTTFFPGALDTMASAIDQDLGQYLVVNLLKILVVGAVVGGILALPRAQPVRAVATTALVTAVVGAPVLGLMVWAASGTYVVPTARYGLSLVPLYLSVLAVMLTARQRVAWTSVLLAVSVFAVSLGAYWS